MSYLIELKQKNTVTAIRHKNMITYNGKKVTKKHIEAVLRTMDSTRIFRLYHHIYGGKVEKRKVFDFIVAFAPTKSVAKKAAELSAINKPLPSYYLDQMRKSIEFNTVNARHVALQQFREEMRRGFDSYTKRPIMGHTYLYWASPVFGHNDYNKSRALPIKGNERFCELICRLADKYFPIH